MAAMGNVLRHTAHFARHGAPSDRRPSLLRPARGERIDGHFAARREQGAPAIAADKDQVVTTCQSLGLKGKFTNALRDIGCFQSAAPLLSQRVAPVMRAR